MEIQLENWKVSNLIFSTDDISIERENSFDLNTTHFFIEADDKFVVNFEIFIRDKMFDLEINSMFVFSLDSKITEEFKNSNFPKINAPAIAFPFLRSHIANFTMQSGFEPVILPSINFIKLAEKNNAEK
jgi:preprotein translocase subunit SecB